MKRTDLFRSINEMISVEDVFVEKLAAMDVKTIEHMQFKVTDYLRIRNGLTKLLDDSRRHKDILEKMLAILSGDERNEY